MRALVLILAFSLGSFAQAQRLSVPIIQSTQFGDSAGLVILTLSDGGIAAQADTASSFVVWYWLQDDCSCNTVGQGVRLVTKPDEPIRFDLRGGKLPPGKYILTLKAKGYKDRKVSLSID